MLRLRKILLCDFLYYIVFLIIIIITFCRINTLNYSIYKVNTKEITGKVIEKKIDGNSLELIIKNKEKVIIKYYFNTKKEKELLDKNLSLGDNLQVKGNLELPSSSTTENLFDYRNYLKRKKIYFIMRAEEIKLLRKNQNLFYKIKELVIKRCSINPYLSTFILGDTKKLSKKIITNYRNLGISHLFAISGMHVSLVSSFLLKLFKKLRIREEIRYLLVILILFFYLFLTGLSPSVFRAFLFFLFFSINEIYYFHIKSTNLFLLIFSITLLINPNYIYDVGFLYSYSISFILIYFSNNINKYSNYFLKVLVVSFFSFLISLPISLYSFNQINLLSIIFNLFYVPFVSIIVFPLSLLTFLIPQINPILDFVTSILEVSSILFSKISFLTFIFCKLPFLFYIIYEIFIFISLKKITDKKYLYFVILIILITINFIFPKFQSPSLYVLDVGQGDSILLKENNKTILFDTGGVINFKQDKWKKRKNKTSIVEYVTIPFLKKLGISKIDYLIISHGDSDHMGDSINLINNFKVDNVIFNNGNYNYLEKNLIEVLKSKKIKYYQGIEKINLKKTNIYFLNTDKYNNENDNSNVIYFNINSYKFLLMGDAGTIREKDILDKYNLENIDFLKVGHHGSNTSSSEYFIDSIKPKNCLISVGKNNKYGHPKESVLDLLNNYCDIYRTDLNGSIEIKISKNNYKIKTHIS